MNEFKLKFFFYNVNEQSAVLKQNDVSKSWRPYFAETKQGFLSKHRLM